MEDPVQTFSNGSLAYQVPADEQIPLIIVKKNNHKEEEEEDQEEEVGLRGRQSNDNGHVNGEEQDPSSYFDQGSESMHASSTSEENDDASSTKDVVDSEIQEESLDQNAESLSPVTETIKQQHVDSDSKPVDIETETGLVDDAEFADLTDQEELTEFDVETVLEKQNTHHIYCPNCRSCITRKVILRRRKRKVKGYKPKRDVPRTVFPSDLEQPNPTAYPVDNGISSNDSADHRDNDRPNAFKCLSCFSIFVPTGNGFKLFRCFGESDENQNIQRHQQKEPLASTNWFYSIFVSEKKTVTADIDNAGQASVGTTEFDRTNPYRPSNGTLVKKREIAEEANYSPPPLSGLAPVNSSAVQYIVQDRPASEIGHEEASNATKGKEHIASQNGLISSVPFYSSVGNSYEVKLVNEGKIRPGEGENDISAQDGIFSGSVSTNVDGQLDIIVEKNDTGGAAVKFSVSNTTQQLHLPITSPDRVPANFKDPPLQAFRGDVILTVETGMDESKPSLTTIAPLDEVLPPNVSRGRDDGEWELVKSIVYGGLIESITSLSVVSSAAAAGATTLNILVLGLANLFGGLPLLFHNLRELKKETFRGALSTTNEHEDHYQQVLGHRKNFSLHFTIAVLSFLVFGLLPPVVFAFSFRKSDDKDFKLATAAVASLACIAFLSIAKAFVQKPPKSYIKIVTYYLTIAVAVSGAAYLAGELIEKLVEKLEPSSTLNMPFVEMRQSGKPWTSY